MKELAEFVRTHHPGRAPRDPAERLAWSRTWAATLYDHGWAGPAWPKQWGGLELPLAEQVRYHQVLAAAGVPMHPNPNLGTVGPTIILHGTDAQRERFLAPMLRGDELWAQGFSEPDAGSDLPSLTTRAERTGDGYVVTGTKVWSTIADVADWMFALVRTGPAGSGRCGISYLLVDLSSPGISIHPIRDMTGRSGFSEVRFDDVHVSFENLVGQENGGWAIARTSLGHERSAASAARAHRYERIVAELIALAPEADAVVRQRLADVWTRAKLLTLLSQRSLAAVLRDGDPGPASSVSRLFHARFEQQLHELAVELAGARGMLAASDAAAVERGRWTWGFLRTRASTIGAGTAEIQLTTIGERVLGLPS